MVDLEHLAIAARRVAERSRARMALRITLPVAALTAAPLTQGGPVGPCLLVALGLLALVVYLRWRSREGVRAAWLGLTMGAIPVLALLVAPVCSAWCVSVGGMTEGELLCLLAGALAGAGVSAVAGRQRWRGWSMALVVASLTSMLACVPLGVASLAVTMGPLLAAALVVRLPLALRAA